MKFSTVFLSVLVLLLVIAAGVLAYDNYQIKNGERDLLSQQIWQAVPEEEIAKQKEVGVIALANADCEACETDQILEFFQANLFPNLESEKVEASSPEGQALIEKFGIMSLPTFVFKKGIEEHPAYADLKVSLIKKGDEYMLKGADMGLPIGELLQVPEIGENDRVIGSREAPVVFFDFTDFECPYCGLHENETYPQIKENYIDTGKVKYVFKNAPLDMHVHAPEAHQAAYCVGAQSNDKFWDFKAKLFADQTKWAVENEAEVLREMALAEGIDATQYDDCIASGLAEAQIATDQTELASFGISGVPALFIGDQILGGAYPYESIAQAIEAQLAK